MGFFWQNCCIWEKWSNFGKSACIRAKVVVFVQNWLYLGKSGCNPAKWLYSGKVVVFGESGCIRANVVVIR